MGYIKAFIYLTIKETLGRKSFSAVVFLFIFSLFLSRIFMDFALQDLTKSFVDFSFSFLKFFIFFIALFVTADIFVNDIKKKTIYIILSKKLAREQYIVGRFVGIAFVLAITVTFLTLFCFFFAYVNNFFIPPAYKKPLILFNVLPFIISLWIKSILVSAVVIFFFSFLENAIVILFSSVVIYMAGSSVENIYFFVEIYKEKFSEFTLVTVKILFYLLPNISSLSSDIILGIEKLSVERFLFDILKSLSYTALLLILSGIIFKRKQL